MFESLIAHYSHPNQTPIQRKFGWGFVFFQVPDKSKSDDAN